MAVNQPTWSYGGSKLFNSSGETTAPDDAWSYGQNSLLHEYVASGGGDTQDVFGNMPSPSGVLVMKTMFASGVTGNMPASTGSITKKTIIGVAGTLGTIAGTVVKKISKSLSGDTPEQSGNPITGWITSHSTAGNMPSASGILTTILNPVVATGAKLLKIIGASFKKFLG